MPRPDKDTWVMRMASVTAERSTCVRRAVGCVLTDAGGHILATGYNGVPRGFDHCNDGHPCLGANSPSGLNLDGCDAVHAEQNALLQCRDVELIQTCYVTVSPCLTCVKLLLNTSCERIVFPEFYRSHERALELWMSARRTWKHLPLLGVL